MDTPPPVPPPIESRAQLGAVVVVVVDEEGLAIPGVRVLVQGPQVMGMREAFTDQDGHARLMGLPPGPVTVTVEHRIYQSLRAEVRVEPGRSTWLKRTLHSSECNAVELLLLESLFPDQARRGATVEGELLTSLPWVSLGGTAGLLAHPALGTGEPVSPRLLGLPVAEPVAGAVPRGLVDHLDTRSIAAFGPQGGEIALKDRWCDAPMAAVSVAGDAQGELGASALASGSIQGDHSGLLAGMETGIEGEAAGLSLSARPGYAGRLWGLAAMSPDAWVVGAHGRHPLNRAVLGDLSALVTGTEAGPMARLALETGFTSRATLDHVLSARVEAAAGPGQLAGLISAQGALGQSRFRLTPATRLRLGLDMRPRAEAQLGSYLWAGLIESWASIGQRYEALDALAPDPVRSREALIGVGARPGSTMFMAHGLVAHRADTATGEPLPGRAELQANLRTEFGHLEGLASYSARPALDGYNSDLPAHEAGLLLAWPARYRRALAPTAGLGLRGALQDGTLSGSGAARVGLSYRRGELRAELAVESQLDPEELGQAWVSLSVQTGR